ncbi:MAG: hypothetical protein HRT66_13050 [Flavobacteriaceae bacterium]|nr:hypothetical protein [Flavobacteriaceae bacterium]
MDDKNIKDIEVYTDKLLRDLDLDSPSSNFTSSVMDGIMAEKITGQSITGAYKPLISKSWWAILGVISVLSLVAILIINPSNDGWFGISDYINLPKVSMPSLNIPSISIPSIDISTKSIYFISIVGIMFITQMLLVKRRYLDKG